MVRLGRLAWGVVRSLGALAAALGAVALMTACSTWATWATTGSLYRGRCTHLRVRGATDLSGVAVTVKVSTSWPGCPREARP